MGKFAYGLPPEVIEIDDRLLAHLRLVMSSKLRRDESFMFTWEYPVSSGSGHTTMWIHPSVPLQFLFAGNREPQINRTWLSQLMMSSNSIGGLRVVPEPPDVPVFANEPEPVREASRLTAPAR